MSALLISPAEWVKRAISDRHTMALREKEKLVVELEDHQTQINWRQRRLVELNAEIEELRQALR